MASSANIKNRNWSRRLATHELPALGFIELSSISRGLFVTDVILKKAPVKVIASQPVSSGKHVILFFGDVASVESSFEEAVSESKDSLVNQVLIPAVHEKLVPYLDSIWEEDPMIESVDEEDSIGIVESSTLAAAILGADRALKRAEVGLCRMRLGQGIGGKAYFVLMGIQEEVEAALEASETCLKELESLCRVDLIPRPQNEALDFF